MGNSKSTNAPMKTRVRRSHLLYSALISQGNSIVDLVLSRNLLIKITQNQSFDFLLANTQLIKAYSPGTMPRLFSLVTDLLNSET